MVTLVDHTHHHKRVSVAVRGLVAVARDVPREDLGVWIELPGGMRRLFGVEPVSLLEPEGLPALIQLDRLEHALRAGLGALTGTMRRAIELGHGVDKVLVTEHPDHHVVYARRLFTDRARSVMVIHTDGRLVVPARGATRELSLPPACGVTASGESVRFVAPDGGELARIAIPWLGADDRSELARRIGLVVAARSRPDLT